MEIWKDVIGYEGIYQVSDFGRVKSMHRLAKIKYGTRSVKEKILKPSFDSNGYLMVSLSRECIRKTFQIHQLVAMAFLNHKRCGHDMIVDHKDSQPTNNNLDNLQIITQRENVVKGIKQGTSSYTGVCWDKRRKKWKSAISINGKTKQLGYFKLEYNAHLAYQKQLKQVI